MILPFYSPPSGIAAVFLLTGLAALVGQTDETRTTSVDALVQQILATNPELKFYQSEIAVARGEQRTVATWTNPELSATIGEKRVRSGPVVSDGAAWSVSVRQTF